MASNNLKTAPPAFLKYLVFSLVSFAMLGNYYIYDSISPLADLLKQQLNFTDSNIGLLQAIYSFPNIIMVLIGGIIIDRIGTRKSVLFFTLFIGIGATITALTGNIVIMAAGRLVFGLGAESMIVAITTILARWFKQGGLSFAFGLNLTVARLGSFLALNSPTWGRSLYNYWQSPLLITVAAGVFAVICIVCYYVVDNYSARKFEMPGDGAQDKIEFKQVFNFGKSFWFISLLCVTFYSAMFPFQTFAIKYFLEAHGTSREVGGNLSSILTLAAMICTPLFGLLADKVGRRALLMMLGSLLIVPVYLMMAYKVGRPDVMTDSDFFHLSIGFLDIHAAIPIYLIIPMTMMGIAFSLVPAVMWPYVALLVDGSKLGTAYGVMTMIQNIGLTLFNLLIGFVNQASNASAANPSGYNPGMWIFSICGLLGIVLALLLFKADKGKAY